MQNTNRESMPFDVVIVGAGPAGLSASIRLAQLAQASGVELNICVVEKGSEVGAHILSGAVVYSRALDELIPNWHKLDLPLIKVEEDEMHVLVNDHQSLRIPNLLVPKPCSNKGNYITSLGILCRWLANHAESLGVTIFPGFAANELLYNKRNAVIGVATGDMGLDQQGNQKPTYEAGVELHASYTLLAEGARGHLGKQLIRKFDLDRDCAHQNFAIGLKELWEVPDSGHQIGKVLHTIGWPLGFKNDATGGGFAYHTENNQIALGLIVDLNYSNPYLSPFDEFQRWKYHPVIKQSLLDGRRVSYGAKAIVKGGINALPQLTVPGALLIGDNAGFLNPLKIKGTHTAIKSGILAAEGTFDKIQSGKRHDVVDFQKRFEGSWLHDELHQARNATAAWHKHGMLLGSAWSWVEHSILRSKTSFTFSNGQPDHKQLKKADESKKIYYPKADGVFAFDKTSSVYLSNTNHEENQPCHLVLDDASIPLTRNLPQYAEPAQRYCPAGVYEVIEVEGENRFQINAQNCVHCKTCDIKDPAQNITWVAPEGGGGPRYPNM